MLFLNKALLAKYQGDDRLHEIDGKRVRVRIEVFAMQNGHILLSDSGSGIPSYPGGGHGAGTYYDTAARELMEEAGWLADDFRYLPLPIQNEGWAYSILPRDEHMAGKWDLEVTYYVACHALSFSPDDSYHKLERDTDEFSMMPVQDAYYLTRDRALVETDQRKFFQAMCRLAVMRHHLSIAYGRSDGRLLQMRYRQHFGNISLL